MKKIIWFLFVTLALAACSRKSPTPTIPPTPTRSNAPRGTARATPTPLFSPTPRVTIVPSATRLQPDAQGAASTPSASPTSTDEPTPTLIPSSTPTIAVIDAGPPTNTPSPTATAPDSPLPAPTQSAASEDTSTETPQPTQTPSSATTPRPTAEAATATDTSTPQPTSSEDASPTPTFTLTPTSTDEPESEADWSFENVWTYFDQDDLVFYVRGEVLNNATTDQRIVEFLPLVYDEDGIPLNSELYFLPEGYDLMMTTVSVAPDKRLPFSFSINLPQYVASVEDNYEILISSEPGEATRDDLDILWTENDNKENWPDTFSMWGRYENPGSDLVEYVALILTLFDDQGRIIGVGMQFDTHTSVLNAGEHDFQIIVKMQPTTLNWYMSDYPRLQLLSY